MLSHPAHKLGDVSSVDLAEAKVAEDGLDQLPLVAVELDAALRASPGGSERIEKREVVAFGEGGEGLILTDDALPVVAAG